MAKKQLKDLFQDKKALALFSAFAIIIAAFIYMVVWPEEKIIVADTNKMSTEIPGANNSGDMGKNDNKSKLDIQTDNEGVAMNNPGYQSNYDPGTNTYNPSVPGDKDLADYMYEKNRPGKEIVEPELEDLNPSGGKSKARARERDYEEPNDDEEEERAPSRRDIEAAEKQKRLLALLEEYKKDKAQKKTEKEQNIVATPAENNTNVSSLNSPSTGLQAGHGNKFFGLYGDEAKKAQNIYDDSLKAIRAMVFKDQTISAGSRVQLRLIEPMRLRGRIFPAGTILFGVASISSQRVTITLSQLQFENHLFPLDLSVHDMDGMVGIYVPGEIGERQARNAVGQVVNSVNVPIIGSNPATVAAAGATQAVLNGGQQILRRRVRTPVVKLKNNYYVLLK